MASLKNKKFKYKKLLIIYLLILVLALIFCFCFKWDTMADCLVAFIGVSGTVASLISIYVSAKDEVRLNSEKQNQEQFLSKLDKKVSLILSNTDILKSDIEQFSNNYLDSNINESTDSVLASERESNTTVKTNKESPKEVGWEEKHDEEKQDEEKQDEEKH